MRFYAIFLRVFASFTYCEYTRASPNTLFPIIADYRRVLSHFMSGYFIFHLGHPFMLLFILPHHSFLVTVASWYNARRSFSLSRTTLLYFRVLSRRYAAILAYS